MSVEIAWLAVEVPDATIVRLANAAQTVGAFANAGSVGPLISLQGDQQVGEFGQNSYIGGESSVDVAWFRLEVPDASAVSSLSAAQAVAAFTASVSVATTALSSVDIAWLRAEVPEALGSRSLTAAQQVGEFLQSASMFQPVGSINGGGPITDGFPHRSVNAAQQVGAFLQSAAGGGDNVAAPRLASAAQQIEDFTQAVAISIRSDLAAAQLVGAFVQSARMRTMESVELQAAQQVGSFASDAQAEVTDGVAAGGWQTWRIRYVDRTWKIRQTIRRWRVNT